MSKHGQKPRRKETAFREAISRARLETADIGLSFDPVPVTEPSPPPSTHRAEIEAPVPEPGPSTPAVPQPAVVVRARREHVRYEYRLERVKGSRRRLRQRLDRLGRKGWELVAVEAGTVFLRRPTS